MTLPPLTDEEWNRIRMSPDPVAAFLGIHPLFSSLDEEYVFQITISGISADIAINAMFSDNFFVEAGRVSPIKFFVRMTGREANQLMSLNPEYEIVRAPEDWKL